MNQLDSGAGREEARNRFGVDLRGSEIRAELIGDVDGFFQNPHTDTADKRITWITYLGSVEENGEVGTDLYDDNLNPIKTVPWGFNNGLIFVPSSKTWHGFPKGRSIQGVRKAFIVNFVEDWDDEVELFRADGA